MPLHLVAYWNTSGELVRTVCCTSRFEGFLDTRERASSLNILTCWPARLANIGVIVMSNLAFEAAQSDEEVFDQNVTDDMLEVSGSLNGRALGYTLAYCSGLSVCPAVTS
jgi:hypothetical protein